MFWDGNYFSLVDYIVMELIEVPNGIGNDDDMQCSELVVLIPNGLGTSKDNK